jgi:hypothetical protein
MDRIFGKNSESSSESLQYISKMQNSDIHFQLLPVLKSQSPNQLWVYTINDHLQHQADNQIIGVQSSVPNPCGIALFSQMSIVLWHLIQCYSQCGIIHHLFGAFQLDQSTLACL